VGKLSMAVLGLDSPLDLHTFCHHFIIVNKEFSHDAGTITVAIPLAKAIARHPRLVWVVAR
jgi:hypothetical protein